MNDPSPSDHTTAARNPYAAGVDLSEESEVNSRSRASRVTGFVVGAISTALFFTIGWAVISAALPGVAITAFKPFTIPLSLAIPAPLAPIAGWIIGNRVGRKTHQNFQRLREVELKRAAMTVQAADLKEQLQQHREATKAQD